jgi:hypothetical protein
VGKAKKRWQLKNWQAFLTRNIKPICRFKPNGFNFREAEGTFTYKDAFLFSLVTPLL